MPTFSFLQSSRVQRWAQRILLAALVLVLAGLLGRGLLPVATEGVLRRLAVREGLEVGELQVRKLGWGGLALSRITFRLDSPQGPLSVDLKDLVLSYSLIRVELHSLDMAEATITLDHRASPERAAGHTDEAAPLLFPLRRLSIAHLTLHVNSPWGGSELAGRVEIGKEGEEQLNLVFEDRTLTLRGRVSPAAHTLDGSLVLSGGLRLLTVHAERLDDLGYALTFHADDAVRLLESLSRHPLLPEAMRHAAVDHPSVVEPIRGVALDVRVDAKETDGSVQIVGKLTREHSVLAETSMAMSEGQPMSGEGRIDLPAATLFDLVSPWLPEQEGRPTAGHAQGRFKAVSDPGKGWSVDGQLKVSGLALSTRWARLADAELLLRTRELNERNLALDILLTVAGKSSLWAELHAPAQGPLNIDARWSLSAAELLTLAAPALPKALRTWSAESGRLRGTALLQRHAAAWSGKAQMTVNDVDLTMGHARLEDASAELSVTDVAAVGGHFKARAATLRLTPSWAAGPMSVATAFHRDGFDITEARCAVFGGRVELDPTEARQDGSVIRSTLSVHRLDLARLLRSVDQEGLSGTGRLEGRLPLIFTPNPANLEVRDGRITSLRGGVLKYQNPGLSGSNIAFKALSHFLYDKLTASVNYSPTGEYRLGLRMEGRNRDVLNAHPLALNLNIKGLLPGLLRESILSGDFDRPMLEWVNANKLERPEETPAEAPPPPDPYKTDPFSKNGKIP